jgi:hypothetical protein
MLSGEVNTNFGHRSTPPWFEPTIYYSTLTITSTKHILSVQVSFYHSWYKWCTYVTWHKHASNFLCIHSNFLLQTSKYTTIVWNLLQHSNHYMIFTSLMSFFTTEDDKWCLQYFSYIVAASFIGGGNQSTRRKERYIS